MANPIEIPGEALSNPMRGELTHLQPKGQRTYTPTQAVLSRSAGIYHWTPEGRRLFDFTSGVLVANLGHNPISWMERFNGYMGWPKFGEKLPTPTNDTPAGYFSGVAMTAYNGVTPLELQASKRLIDFVSRRPGGQRLNRVMWAASGSEGIQKALWASMAYNRKRPLILATRFGFHGKKGLANSVTGSETDSERDPRVKFISFPMHECIDLSHRNDRIYMNEYENELQGLSNQYGNQIGTLITEPYLGGGGSFHPQKEYLQRLQNFCRERDIIFILDEVQSNFGRTGEMFAYESYGLEPDLVVLGKGLGNGVPVAAVMGRGDIFDALNYGEASDTWSANPLNCAAVLATIDEFEAKDILGPMRESSKVIEAGLVALKKFPMIAHIRGEQGGMVWGIEFQNHGGKTAADWANRFILECYLGEGPDSPGVHILGALAKKVVRISPPLVISLEEAKSAMAILTGSAERMCP